jgi:hypothetical protein
MHWSRDNWFVKSTIAPTNQEQIPISEVSPFDIGAADSAEPGDRV